MSANFRSRWFVLDQRRRRFIRLDVDALNKAVKGFDTIPHAEPSVVIVVMVVTDQRGRFVEAVVSALPCEDRVLLLGKIAESYRNTPDRDMVAPFDLESQREIFWGIRDATGIQVDDLVGRVFAGHSPLSQAVAEFRDVTEVFGRYSPHTVG